jgi:pyruvate ferredoxin oxidoreductase gamma subunit
VVTAAELLSIAAFREGKFAQAFPTFGSERMGAPVVSFCRWDNKPIRLREPVMQPDAIILQDSTLLQASDPFEGLAQSGYALVNSNRTLDELGLSELVQPGRLRGHAVIPASSIALRHLGRPLPNACLLGAFAALTGLLNIESVVAAIYEKFPGRVGASNERAARSCYEIILQSQGAVCVETA